jgi:pyridoxamine 5'-phosphate oxidase
MSGIFAETTDPTKLFDEWFAEAEKAESGDATAMALATCDSAGRPDIRLVLLKGHDARGFVFYTNLESAKAEQLAANPFAALAFHWESLNRQVRVRGPVEPVSDAEADAYFASRHRSSRIGAWASRQSRPLESRFALEKAVAAVTARFGIGEIPRPAFWSGYRVVPLAIEFWRDKPFRLHDRLVFTRTAPDEAWTAEWLYP